MQKITNADLGKLDRIDSVVALDLEVRTRELVIERIGFGSYKEWRAKFYTKNGFEITIKGNVSDE